MPLARPGERKKKDNRVLTRNQWKTLFRSFMNPKVGRPITAVPMSETGWPALSERLSDYEKNVGPGEYNHRKYLDYLIREKDLDETLLMTIPKIEY